MDTIEVDSFNEINQVGFSLMKRIMKEGDL
jgi:hypothetical protein